jgi:hypothetical protein
MVSPTLPKGSLVPLTHDDLLSTDGRHPGLLYVGGTRMAMAMFFACHQVRMDE